MTGRVLTVSADSGDAGASRLHQTVLASLPGYFRPAAAPGVEVQLVSGDQAGWPELARSAASSGARAIMLTGTRALTADAVRRLSQQVAAAGVLVAVDTAYASDRSWSEALPLLAADAKEAAILDSVITVPRPDLETSGAGQLCSALVEQLATVRPLLGDLVGLEAAHVSGRNYVLAGVVKGIAVTLAGVISGTGEASLDLDLVGTRRRWQARFGADTLARPTLISLNDSSGRHTRPVVFESAHRAGWLNLHHAICHEAPLRYVADQLASDLALAESAFQGPANSGISDLSSLRLEDS
jgi:hypothetical protein